VLSHPQGESNAVEYISHANAKILRAKVVVSLAENEFGQEISGKGAGGNTNIDS
jgi:hypothetical protein